VAASSVANILKVPGDLFFGCTSPVGLAPYGGSALGPTRGSRFIPNVRTRDITAEEFGGVVTDTVYGGQSPVFLSILRDFDAAAVSTIFPQGGQFDVRSGGDRPGALLGKTKGGVLYFRPKASSHPGVWFYRAIPLPRDAAEMNLHANEEIGFGVVFRATPDKQGRVHDIGLPGSISP